MDKVLIIGASGTVGGTVAHLLGERGYEVLAATRHPDRQPALAHGRWVALDLADTASVEAAFAGVQRAFLMAPPGRADHEALLAPLIDAAKRHGLAKVVLMTAQGVDASDEIPMRRAELRLEASGVPFGIVRPNWFMQNLETSFNYPIRHFDAISVPAGDAASGFIDARDIAAVASELLSRDGTDGAFDLTGPEALTYAQAAELLSREAGRPIRYEDQAPEAFHQVLLGAGTPPAYAQLLLDLFAGVRQGRASTLTDGVQQVLGRAPRTLASYVHERREAFAKAPAPAGV